MIKLSNEEYKICGYGRCLIEALLKESDHLKIESALTVKGSSYRIIGFTTDFFTRGGKIISFDESSEIEAVPVYLIRYCYSVFIFPPRIKRVIDSERTKYLVNGYGKCCPKIEPGESDQRFVSINGYRVVLNHFPLEIACQLSARHRFCLRETTRFVGDRSFHLNKNIRTVVFPSSVEYIGNRAFESCNHLQFIIFKKNSRLKRIGYYSFAYTSAESIEIPTSVEEIKNGSFYECENLVSVKFPKNSRLKRIGDCSFAHAAVKIIEIPSSVEEIKSGSFREIENLMSAKFSEDSKLKTIGSQCFYNTLINSLSIPSNVDQISKYAFGCYSLKLVIFAEDTKLKKIDEWMFFSTNIESINIPSPIEEIEEYSFFECSNLRSVTFSENSKLKRIGYKSFSSIAIESICIPSSVEEIKDRAFSDCLYLRSISYQNKSNIKRFGRDVFRNCPRLNTKKKPNEKNKRKPSYLFFYLCVCTNLNLKGLIYPSH